MSTSVAALALFFLSGFAALLYQVIWQRLLAFFSGADIYSATVVVASFMAGIGCGSFAGGHVADRVTRAQSVALFAAAELCVAVFGYFSKHLFYDVLYLQYGELAHTPSLLAAVLFFALLCPTFFMGASLPLLSRGLTRDVDDAASTVGWLYAVNTGGAALGAFAGTWIILPQAGLDGSLNVGALLNLICAFTAAPIAWMLSTQVSDVVRPSRAPIVGAVGESRGPLLWTLMFGLSGFVGLSLEIVWFRLLGVVLKSTFFAFGTLLAVYLGGLGLGGAIGGVIAAKVRRPAQWFLLLQAGAGVYAALSLIVFISGLHVGGAFEWFSTYLRGYDGVDVRAAILRWREAVEGPGHGPRDLVRVYLLLPAALIVPPTVMAGMSLPLLQRVVQHDLDRLGRRVGFLLTANVVGSTAGAAITGLLLLDWLGTGGTLRLLAAISLGFAGVAITQALSSHPWRRLVACGALAAGTVVLVASVPAGKALWSRLHGTTPDLLFVHEDGSGLSVLRGERRDFRQTTVMVNGLGQSWLPYGGLHTVLGALPAFIHEGPRRAALIGLGSGDTLYALAGRRELESITSIEIVGPQLTTLRELAAWQGYPGLLGILNDPRIRHVEADGRRYLSSVRESFDIIEADALRPYSAYAGNLYSDAYFRLLRRRLAPGGLAVSWAPTGRVLHTFLAVFPHVVQHSQVVIGSDQPIRIDREAIGRRLAEPLTAQHYTAAGINIAEELRPFLVGEWRVYHPSEHRRADDLNTDLRPRDELDIPAILPLPGLRIIS